MFKIFKYGLFDLIRSRWFIVYTLFYLLTGFMLFFLNDDISTAVITLLNVIILLTPLIGSIFGVIYYYNSRDFIDLLLGQPIKRSALILGIYLSTATSLSLSLITGIGIPFLVHGLINSDQVLDVVNLLVVGTALTFIFTAISFNIALANENRIRGFSLTILVWLFLAVIYDGIFLLLLSVFSEYPLQKLSLIAVILNPIDLSRVLILLRLDISALMGYTGAVFQKFLGSSTGYFLALAALLVWEMILILVMLRQTRRKDF